MKTFNTIRVILVVLIGIIMCSCTSRISTEVSPTGEAPFRKAIQFKHNNHSFIRFSGSLDSEGMGVVHDPDCKCMKKVDY